MLNENTATTRSPPRPNCPHLCHPSRWCDSCWPVWAPSPSSRADRLGERDGWTTRTPRARGPPLAATGAPGPGRSRCCVGDSSGGGRSDPRRTPPRTPPGPGNGSRPLWPCTAWCCFHICSQEQRNKGNTGAVREKRGKGFCVRVFSLVMHKLWGAKELGSGSGYCRLMSYSVWVKKAHNKKSFPRWMIACR